MPEYLLRLEWRFTAADDPEARRLARLAINEAENPAGCTQEEKLQRLQEGKPPKGLKI